MMDAAAEELASQLPLVELLKARLRQVPGAPRAAWEIFLAVAGGWPGYLCLTFVLAISVLAFVVAVVEGGRP